jgi:DNA-binding protein HU-beta
VPNKAEFVELVAQRLGSDKKSAAIALDAVLETIYAEVAKGEKVTLTGFGIFEKRERAARIGRNPATGAKVKVKKTYVPAFRAGTEFKAVTSGAKKLAKSAPAKRVAAATVAKKAAAKRAGVKAAPAKAVKAAPVKTVAKKAVAKAPAKKVAAKAPAKKVAAKAPAKKLAVKKAPAKRGR